MAAKPGELVEETDPGAYLSSDCRGNLRRLHDDFTRATGLHLRAGTEPEMMWLRLNPDAPPSVPGLTKPYCYHIDQFSELQPIIHKVIEYCQAVARHAIEGDREYVRVEIELHFQFDQPHAWTRLRPTAREWDVQTYLNVLPWPRARPVPAEAPQLRSALNTVIDR